MPYKLICIKDFDAKERKEQVNVSRVTEAIQWLNQLLKSLLWFYQHISSNGNIVFLVENIDSGFKAHTEGDWICLPLKF